MKFKAINILMAIFDLTHDKLSKNNGKKKLTNAIVKLNDI